eukprot:gene17148-5307_t
MLTFDVYNFYVLKNTKKMNMLCSPGESDDRRLDSIVRLNILNEGNCYCTNPIVQHNQGINKDPRTDSMKVVAGDALGVRVSQAELLWAFLSWDLPAVGNEEKRTVVAGEGHANKCWRDVCHLQWMMERMMEHVKQTPALPLAKQ